MSEVKDGQTPGWTTVANDMKFEYLHSGHIGSRLPAMPVVRHFLMKAD
jgi:hypothetical protein